MDKLLHKCFWNLNFDKKIKTVVNNSAEVARNYVDQTKDSIEKDILLMVIVTIQFAPILLHLLIYDKLKVTFTYTARGASIATQRCQRVPIRYFECDVSSAPFT